MLDRFDVMKALREPGCVAFHNSYYCANMYCSVGNDTKENQLEDYLFVAEGTSPYPLVNALALIESDAQEKEIKSFVKDLRCLIPYAQKKIGSGQKLN